MSLGGLKLEPTNDTIGMSLDFLGLCPKNMLESIRIGGKLIGASIEKKNALRERERESKECS